MLENFINFMELFSYINKMNKVREICKLLQMKSKMNSIKKESQNYINKLNSLKNFFLNTNTKINFNKQYIKLVQTKYIIKNYVENFKYKKYLKYKALVKAILERGVENHIKIDLAPYAIIIQRNVRAYLARLSWGELYEGIIRRRQVLKEEIRVRKIQKHFRKHYYMEQILKKQKVVDKFVGMIKLYKRIYLKRKIIEARLREFTEEEDIKYEDSTFVNSVTLFPERKLESNPNEKGSQATVQKMKNLQKFYDKKLQTLNPSKIQEVQF